MEKTFKYKVPSSKSKTIKVSQEDIEFICGNNHDDDACANRIVRNYGLEIKDAWKVISQLWDKYGRDLTH